MHDEAPSTLETQSTVIRRLRPGDLERVIAIDAKIVGRRRDEYFKSKLQQNLVILNQLKKKPSQSKDQKNQLMQLMKHQKLRLLLAKKLMKHQRLRLLLVKKLQKREPQRKLQQVMKRLWKNVLMNAKNS